jgi:hypothetical protein
MRDSIKSLALAMLLICFVAVSGCAKKEGAGGTDTTAAKMDTGTKMEVDTSGKKTEVSVETKSYDFDGTATAVDAANGTVTINHEAIEGYKPAGSDTFKLGNEGMAEFIDKDMKMHYTIEVTGDQAVVSAFEDADEDEGGGDTTAAGK